MNADLAYFAARLCGRTSPRRPPPSGPPSYRCCARLGLAPVKVIADPALSPAALNAQAQAVR
ncbi:hypothetical protein [Streptomyces cavernae]|uniref:hypothetical protein n=1 Tax=Streptomyces cavernae TaxID=2259034 RepID=UPI000FEC17E1|nr:hypothetical protein [Streptomyces cavernae]